MAIYTAMIFSGDLGQGLEVLRDGKSFTWGPGFKVTRLTMGRSEAKALVEGEEIIRRFVETSGIQPPVAKKHLLYIGSQTWALEKQASFKMDGSMVNEPWLLLSYVKKNGIAQPNLGFGLDKATGIIEVWSDIMTFAE